MTTLWGSNTSWPKNLITTILTLIDTQSHINNTIEHTHTRKGNGEIVYWVKVFVVQA